MIAAKKAVLRRPTEHALVAPFLECSADLSLGLQSTESRLLCDHKRFIFRALFDGRELLKVLPAKLLEVRVLAGPIGNLSIDRPFLDWRGHCLFDLAEIPRTGQSR